MGGRGWFIFGWMMDGKSKKKDDNAGSGTFFVVDSDFSTICKIEKAISYISGVEVFYVYLLTEFIGFCDVKAICIHDGMVRENSR